MWSLITHPFYAACPTYVYQLNKDPAQILIRWSLQHGYISQFALQTSDLTEWYLSIASSPCPCRPRRPASSPTRTSSTSVSRRTTSRNSMRLTGGPLVLSAGTQWELNEPEKQMNHQEEIPSACVKLCTLRCMIITLRSPNISQWVCD